MAPVKQKPIKKAKMPSSDEEEEEEDDDIQMNSSDEQQSEDFDNSEEDISENDDEDNEQQENEDYDEDESLNSDEIPNLSITEDEDEDKPKKKKGKNISNDDSNSVLGESDDDNEDDDEEEESEKDSEDEEQDLDNIEAEYSENEEEENDQDLFQQNVNSSNYFEKILKVNKQNLSQLDEIELEAEFLKSKPLMKINIDKEEIYQNDEGEFQKMINEMIKNANEEESKLYPLTKLTRSRNLNLEQGISLLNSKNEIFANYLICLNFYMLYKLNGIPLKDSPVVKKLIYYKTLLSKLKPVEKKMDYQISKLMKLSLKATEKGDKTTKGSISQDPISFKPRPEMIEDDEESQEQEEQEDISENVSNLSEDEDKPKKQPKKAEAKQPAKYKVLKTAAVYKEEDKQKQRMEVEKKRRVEYLVRKLGKNLNADINTFKDDKPLVNRFSEVDKLEKREREIREYEEANFIRLPTTKEDKRRLKQIEKNKQKLERIDDMDELKNMRELLHHQKLTHDPEIERQEQNRLQKTLQKYNKGNNKFGGNKKFSKGSQPTKRVKKN